MIYSFEADTNHRLVLHDLCKLVSLPPAGEDVESQISDDEDEDEEYTRIRESSSSIESVVEENKQICEISLLMIEMSYDLGPVQIAYPPETTGDENNDNHAVLREGRCELHESILTVTDHLGKTPLHILCENSIEPNMLQVLLSSTKEKTLRACAPSALTLITAKDSRGATPLHYVAYSRNCSFSSIEVMMNYCEPSFDGEHTIDPTTCVDIEGETPLHWALDGYMSPRRIKQLLRNSSAALHIRNLNGKAPFDLFTENFVDANWKEHEIPASETWRNIKDYLRTVDEVKDESEWRALHMLAASDVDFPRVIYEMALHFDGNDASLFNDNGMLPLHLLCSNKSYEASKDIIGPLLIQKYPQAAHKREKRRNRLPLHIAVESKMPLQFVALLLKAYPNSLNIEDPATGLWPYLLAAVENCETVDMSYSMLRADPSIIQIAVNALAEMNARSAARAPAELDPNEVDIHTSRRLKRLAIRNEND